MNIINKKKILLVILPVQFIFKKNKHCPQLAKLFETDCPCNYSYGQNSLKRGL